MFAPVADRVKVSPEQITELLVEMFTVGLGKFTMLTLALFEHPDKVLVPETVKSVFEVTG